MAYTFDSRVRYSEIDMEQKLTRMSLVDYFQDCSTFQSEECDNGLTYLRGQGRAWMILSWQIEILRRPSLGEKITTATWAYGFKAFYGYRNYAMYDAAGDTLAKANSVWVFIDVETGHPARVTPEIVAGYGIEEKLSMEECSRKIKVPEGQEAQDALQVCRYHLDVNRHVNNGQYILMAEEYLPPKFEPKRLRVEYRKQAKLHDMIVPMVHEEQDTIVVSLCDEQASPYAIIEYSR
ncbi:MAG: thioesterase [Lachnospiraceae bacterium]|nr:thioesterase [Lachnospiraceae bacterium]